MITQEQYLKVALNAAKKAGITFKANFGKPKKVSIKNNDIRNSVTNVDLAIERQLRKNLQKAFPKTKVIGEELGSAAVLKADWVWIIDPIDGTNNFISGIPLCCISIALWHKGQPMVAVLYNPVTNQLFSASRGKGAFLNGKKIAVTKVKDLRHSFGGLGWSLKTSEAVKMFSTMITKARKVRALGTTALQLAYVACGIYDYYVVNDMHIWDVAGGILLIEEAGGKVTDWKGKCPALNVRRLIASNEAIHKEILKLLVKIA
jgi:myo-inositol-1(or 4)-monophosphatase